MNGQRTCLALLLFLLCSMLFGAIAPPEFQTQDKNSKQGPTAPFDRPGKFLRSAAECGDCHEEQLDAIAGGVHARIPKSPQLDACETCHGPGAVHADDNETTNITQPAKLSAKSQRKLCGRCHAYELADHGGPLDTLLAAGKRCSDCHRVHEIHANTPAAKHPASFRDRAAQDAAATAVGMPKCVDCHRDKPNKLGRHRALAAREHPWQPGWDPDTTCERCHGNGSEHVASHGIARLITRPDRVVSGTATCRSCHSEVDPVEFHWKGRKKPLLGTANGKLRCTTCHGVHHESETSGPRTDLAATGLRGGDCARCHAPAFRELHGTVHQSLATVDSSGCISCHAGGEQHAASGGRPELVERLRGATARVQIQTCNACHGGQKTNCSFSLGAHARADIGCLDCHSPASGAHDITRADATQDNCFKCHAGVALAFRHANHHPIDGIGCAGCHDPHRGRTQRTLRQETCLKCHREYRGPYVYAHHADKGEGCLACHLPHGGSHRKLLKARRSRDVCLACHADLPSFHDQSAGSVYRNCLSCHTKVHGSNRNRFFFR